MENVNGCICIKVDGEKSSLISCGLSDETIFVFCVLHALRASRSANIPIERIHQLIDVFDKEYVLVEEDVE